MLLSELETQVTIILNQLHVSSTKSNLLRGVASQFMVEDFGVLVCCINRMDYSQVNNVVIDHFKDWRPIYITTNDNLLEAKYKILWVLMRGGYMKWLRYTFPRQVKNVLNGPENLGQKIIEERLRLWAGKPKYKFLIEDNMGVLKSGVMRELTSDPSFFDYMPEEEVK